MEFWKEVRRQVLTNELSKRGACKKYGLGWHTLTKILAHDEPPGYRQAQPAPQQRANNAEERQAKPHPKTLVGGDSRAILLPRRAGF